MTAEEKKAKRRAYYAKFYSDPANIAKKRAAALAWSRSAKGKKSMRAYQSTPHCKARRKAYMAAYQKTQQYKEVRGAYQKEYRNTPKAKAALRRYYKSSGYKKSLKKYQESESCKQHAKAWKNSLRGHWHSYRSGAKIRGIPFLLTFEQFSSFWQKPCHYSGHTIATIGLDRIDSSKGYSIDNVVPCCQACNVAKLRMSPEDYLAHCKEVVRRFKLPHH